MNDMVKESFPYKSTIRADETLRNKCLNVRNNAYSFIITLFVIILGEQMICMFVS